MHKMLCNPLQSMPESTFQAAKIRLNSHVSVLPESMQYLL